MSDYLTVNSTMGSTIYYSFYEAQEPSIPLSQTPIPICLQDGPECSSMFGNFYQPGPWRLSTNISRKPNLDSWNRIFGFLVLDNLIGFGLSIVSSLKKFQEINMIKNGPLPVSSKVNLGGVGAAKGFSCMVGAVDEVGASRGASCSVNGSSTIGGSYSD
ncbi:hypothetical protein M9H77_30265 [Catharanthus roseus]|uniref:Uncharacterized protein n=1 Tax=Catharanthus roseus TaxID=4058 RepID=A0ACC0A110_CATRO|nr:hypothetical protein M9H77_30265 [Catharanthus roseus]